MTDLLTLSCGVSIRAVECDGMTKYQLYLKNERRMESYDSTFIIKEAKSLEQYLKKQRGTK